jgi:antitoxin component YwqK of YwqJK toxin-antitoxin module
MIIAQFAKAQRIDTTFDNIREIKSIIYFKDSQKDKVLEYYHDKLFSELNFKNNKQEGIAKYYNTDGGVSQVRHYKNDLLEGLFTEYFVDGKIHSESYFIKGKSDSVFITYYQNGNKQMVRHMKDGRIEGILTFYNENGTKSSEKEYKSGQDVRLTYFYENGNIKYTGAFKDRKMFGERLCYNENGKPANGNFAIYEDGQIERECKCIDGKPEGELKVYDQNNCLIMLVNFKEGKPDGLSTRYTYNEKLYSVELYENGEFVKDIKKGN